MGPVNAPVTVLLLAVTVLISVMALGNRRLFDDLLFEPYAIRVRGQWYRFISHAFVHNGWPHLLVNMLVLYSFGQHVEREMAFYAPAAPALAYGLLYLGGILFSSLPGYRRHAAEPGYMAVGASGAVSAVLFAYILMTPTNGIGLVILPVAMPAWVFGLIYLAYSAYMDRRSQDNVAHDAHFYGAVYGLLHMIALRPAIVLDFIGQLRGA